MIKTELLKNGTLIRHYSDQGFLLLQVETSIKYTDAIDEVPCRYTYKETNEYPEDDINISSEEFLTMLKEVL